MVKFTNNSKTWSNSQSIAQHGEIHKQYNTPPQSIQHPNYTKTRPQQHLMTTIEQYGEIHKQLHNMVKFINNCTTW